MCDKNMLKPFCILTWIENLEYIWAFDRFYWISTFSRSRFINSFCWWSKYFNKLVSMFNALVLIKNVLKNHNQIGILTIYSIWTLKLIFPLRGFLKIDLYIAVRSWISHSLQRHSNQKSSGFKRICSNSF